MALGSVNSKALQMMCSNHYSSLYEHNFHRFSEKSTVSKICIFRWFCSTKLSFIGHATNFFGPKLILQKILSKKTPSFQFCFLSHCNNMRREPHKKWPKMASVTLVSSPTFLISENTALQDSDSQVIYNDLCIICNDLWQDHIPNNDILTRTGVPSMYSHLSQRRLRWIGHGGRPHSQRWPLR